MAIRIDKKIVRASVVKQQSSSDELPRSIKDQGAINDRVRLDPAYGLTEQSLRWPRRPSKPEGFSGWVSDWIGTPYGKFAIAMSFWEDGEGVAPVELWVLGHEAPPEGSIIARALSKVMQTGERPWVAYHLAALTKAVETAAPFKVSLPDRTEKEVHSMAAAIAVTVESRLRAIGWLRDEDFAPSASSPMLAAMMSRREPKTGSNGGLAWMHDVRNPVSGEDFVLFLKELVFADGRVVPYSLWLSGRPQPRESEAVCKLVSIGLRHRDPLWGAFVLRLLEETHDRGSEFWGPVHGTDKTTCYRSTWAYVAAAIRYRMRQLGMIGPDGLPLVQAGLFRDAPPPSAPQRAPCPACGQNALHRSEGCDVCALCGYSRCG